MRKKARRKKKQKKPVPILRIVRHFGWHPGRVVSEILEWIEIFAIAGLLALLVIVFITVRMSVPTGSMIPTIDPKDSFYVDRVSYYFRAPKPGDVVVFWHTEEVLVNKVVDGSPAQRAGVEAGGRIISINREPVFSAAGGDEIVGSLAPGQQILLEISGTAQLDLGPKELGVDSLAALGVVTRERRLRYVKRLIAIGGQTVKISGGDVSIDGEKLVGERFDRYYYSNDPRMRYGVNETLVPEGKLFVLGDNSSNSWDSRYWGFVDEDAFIGEPYFRVWPLSRFGPMNGYFHF
jgi:signal peptidase I